MKLLNKIKCWVLGHKKPYRMEKGYAYCPRCERFVGLVGDVYRVKYII